MISRRSFLWLYRRRDGRSACRRAASGGSAAAGRPPAGPLPPSIAALTSMRDQAQADHRRRAPRADRAGAAADGASRRSTRIMLAGGTSLVYFTDIRWGGSERLFAVRHPGKGNPFFVCPAFEEDRAREQLALGPFGGGTPTSRTWQEDESPFERVAQGLKDRGIATGPRRHRGDDQVRVRRQHRRRGAGS